MSEQLAELKQTLRDAGYWFTAQAVHLHTTEYTIHYWAFTNGSGVQSALILDTPEDGYRIFREMGGATNDEIYQQFR